MGTQAAIPRMEAAGLIEAGYKNPVVAGGVNSGRIHSGSPPIL